MPTMPHGNIENSIKEVLQWEKRIRDGYDCNVDDLKIDDYWKDILILLKIYALRKKHNNNKVKTNVSLC
jgi:hypothetical protein